jgi:hypothetical protein
MLSAPWVGCRMERRGRPCRFAWTSSSSNPGNRSATIATSVEPHRGVAPTAGLLRLQDGLGPPTCSHEHNRNGFRDARRESRPFELRISPVWPPRAADDDAVRFEHPDEPNPSRLCSPRHIGTTVASLPLMAQMEVLPLNDCDELRIELARKRSECSGRAQDRRETVGNGLNFDRYGRTRSPAAQMSAGVRCGGRTRSPAAQMSAGVRSGGPTRSPAAQMSAVWRRRPRELVHLRRPESRGQSEWASRGHRRGPCYTPPGLARARFRPRPRTRRGAHTRIVPSGTVPLDPEAGASGSRRRDPRR